MPSPWSRPDKTRNAFSLEAASQAAAFAAPEPAQQIDAVMARTGLAFNGFPKPASAG